MREQLMTVAVPPLERQQVLAALGSSGRGLTADEAAARRAEVGGIRDADVARAAAVVTRMVRRHVSGGALDEALDVLPLDLSQFIEPVRIGR